MLKKCTKLAQRTWHRISQTLTFKRPSTTSTPTYEFIEDPIDDTTHVVITSGEAAGVVYRYGRVMFDENKLQDNLTVKFGYQVVRNPDQLTDTVLVPIMSVILHDILEKESRG